MLLDPAAGRMFWRPDAIRDQAAEAYAWLPVAWNWWSRRSELGFAGKLRAVTGSDDVRPLLQQLWHWLSSGKGAANVWQAEIRGLCFAPSAIGACTS
eukprot:g50342.t1